MEELYSDLENYNDVNAVQELRDENKELKLKLEEYETAMEKLQKDYDNLSMEFNNLQTNYSSLLKTARAEVERKTKMITQLNHEKDEIVLKALQGNNRKVLVNRNKPKTNHHNTTKSSAGNDKQMKCDKQVDNKQDKTKKNPDGRDVRAISTNSSASSSEKVKLLNTVDRVIEKVDSLIDNGGLKKAIPHDKSDCKNSPKIVASSIRNRRKSMPAIGLPNLSSDEENEQKNRTLSMTNKSPSRETSGKRNVNDILQRISQESLYNKQSETSRFNPMGSDYQQMSREGFRGRFNKQESDRRKSSDRLRDNKHRMGDKYRDSDKHRETDMNRDNMKYTEVNKFRGTDKYQEGDQYNPSDWHISDKWDTDRHRDSDKYKGHYFRGMDNYREDDKYRENERHRESDKFRESDRHRESDKFRESDRHREGDRFRDNDSYKDKKRYSPDRPHKRPYRESQDKHRGKQRVLVSPPPDPYSQQRYSHDNWTHFGHDSDRNNPRYDERHLQRHSQPFDCDEPSCKRQKIESGRQLDDCRKHRDKTRARSCRPEPYAFDITGASCQSPDDAFSPDTHTDASFVHTIREIKNTAVTPLEDPRVTSKKYILKSENGKTTLTTVASKNLVIRPVDKSLWKIEPVAVPDALLHKPPPQINEHIKDIFMDIHYNPEVNVSVESGEIYSGLEDETAVGHKRKAEIDNQRHQTNKHAIEAIVKHKNIENVQKQNKTTDSNQLIQTTVSEDNKAADVKASKSPTKIKVQSLPHIDLQTHDSFKTTNAVDNISESTQGKQNQIMLSNMAIVQGDLELSDETSDNADLHKQMVQSKQSAVAKTADSTDKCSSKTAPKEYVNVGIKQDGKLNEVDDHKKHKSKRRKTKSKEKELKESVEQVQSTEKRTRSKKEKESKPKNIKSKLTDLFGDSSSLITPEDLGIPAVCVPISEDALDAVDVNIKDIADAPLPSPTIKDICANAHRKDIREDSTVDTNFSNTNTQDKEIAKRIDEQIASPIIDTNIYQNLNSKDDIDNPDVVKTVIISSGIQPQFVMDKKSGDEDRRVADVEVNIQNIADCKHPSALEPKNKNPMLIALATSTPHKFPNVKLLENPVNNLSKSSNSVSIDTIGHSIDKSDTNTQDTNNDAPDVRIFVRRRRKGVKKT